MVANALFHIPEEQYALFIPCLLVYFTMEHAVIVDLRHANSTHADLLQLYQLHLQGKLPEHFIVQ